MRPLGRRQRELLEAIHQHGAAIPVVRTAEDVEVFRSLERRGLVEYRVAHYSMSLHTGSFDATYLTREGEKVLASLK